MLWTGGLTVPSKEVSDFDATRYALLDLIYQHVSNKVRNMSLVAPEKYSLRLARCCEAHMDRNRSSSSKFSSTPSTTVSSAEQRTVYVKKTVKSFKKNQRNKE